MAEQTAQAIEQTEEQAAAAFAAGFDEVSPETTAPAGGSGAEQPRQQPGDTTPPANDFVQVTRQDFAKLMAAAAKVETFTPQFDKVFGTIGNLQQQQQHLLGRLQSETPSGATIAIDDEDFAELKENFPELAGHTKTAIERILKKANLTGTGNPASAAVSPEAVRETWKSQRISEELEELSDLHPDWQTIVGRPDDQSNEFRQWLAAQPEDYQKRILQTTSARITARAIDRFLDSKQQPATPTNGTSTNSRRARLQEAVQPTGTGTRPGPQRSTPEDEFRAGFLSG